MKIDNFYQHLTKLIAVFSIFSTVHAEVLDPKVAKETCLDYTSRVPDSSYVGKQVKALNINNDPNNDDAQGCLFVDPPVFTKDDEDKFTSSDVNDLKRGIGGWYINPSSNDKDVLCSVSTTVIYGPNEYNERHDRYRLNCGNKGADIDKVRKLTYHVDNFYLEPGEVIDLEVSLYDEGEFLSHPFNYPEYSICSLEEPIISCVEHPCKSCIGNQCNDGDNHYVPVNAHYTLDHGNKNQRDGTQCQLLHCGWEDSSFGREIKPISEYFGKWVNNSCMDVDGCIDDGAIRDEGAERKSIRYSFTGDYDEETAPFNASCVSYEKHERCEFDENNGFLDWQYMDGSLKSIPGYWGANSKRCNATRSCQYKGKYYEPGIYTIPGCSLVCAANGYAYCEDEGDVIL